MRDKVLVYALAASVGAHIIILCAVGKTYSASGSVPAPEQQLSAIRVNVETPAGQKPRPRPIMAPRPELLPEQPKPEVKPPVARTLRERLFGVKTPPTPTPISQPQVRQAPQQLPRPPLHLPTSTKSTSNKLPGNPGGALNMGTGSSHGENLGNTGRTPVGWVPGSPGGEGKGSGSGPGVGKPEPVHGAVEGPGKEASPPPLPTPPPAPDIEAKVCAESGMLPSPNCERVSVRSFRPGNQPTGVCTACKPKHVSTLADRSVPEMISGRRAPKYPESAMDKGIEGSVIVEYTINTEGGVSGVQVSSSSGDSSLDSAALAAVEGRRYKPAIQAGIPRNYRKRETFHFALD